QLVSHATIKDCRGAMAGGRIHRIAVARNSDKRCRHWIGDAAQVRFGDWDSLWRRRGRRWNDREIPDIAACDRDAYLLGLLVLREVPSVDAGREAAADDDAANRAGALAGREHAQKPGGRTARSRAVLIVGDVDDPGALADGHTRERDNITRVESRLGAGADWHERKRRK